MKMTKLGTLLTAAVLFTQVNCSACINDAELPDHEREFRSQYNSPRMTSNERSSTDPLKWQLLGGKVAGFAMLATAVGSVLRRRND